MRAQIHRARAASRSARAASAPGLSRFWMAARERWMVNCAAGVVAVADVCCTPDGARHRYWPGSTWACGPPRRAAFRAWRCRGCAARSGSPGAGRPRGPARPAASRAPAAAGPPAWPGAGASRRCGPPAGRARASSPAGRSRPRSPGRSPGRNGPGPRVGRWRCRPRNHARGASCCSTAVFCARSKVKRVSWAASRRNSACAARTIVLLGLHELACAMSLTGWAGRWRACWRAGTAAVLSTASRWVALVPSSRLLLLSRFAQLAPRAQADLGQRAGAPGRPGPGWPRATSARPGAVASKPRAASNSWTRLWACALDAAPRATSAAAASGRRQWRGGAGGGSWAVLGGEAGRA